MDSEREGKFKLHQGEFEEVRPPPSRGEIPVRDQNTYAINPAASVPALTSSAVFPDVKKRNSQPNNARKLGSGYQGIR